MESRIKTTGRQELNSLLASAAIYEQAKAYLIEKGKPLPDFLEEKLRWIYEQATPSIIWFVKRDLGR